MIAPAADRPNLRRLGAIVVFLGLPALLATLCVAGLLRGLEAGQDAQRQGEALTQIRAQLGARAGRGKPPADLTALYLASASGSLARAELLSLLTRMIDAEGGHLVETQVITEQAAEASGLIALQATLDIENDALAGLLHAVETALPLLVVHDIGITRKPRWEPGRAAADLRVALVIHAYWKGKAS